MYVFQIVTKTPVETFWRNSLVNFGNNVFIDFDPQMYDQSDSMIQNASTPIVTTGAQSTSKNLKQLFLQEKERKFHKAVTRIQMKISFEAHDFYAADVFY